MEFGNANPMRGPAITIGLVIAGLIGWQYLSAPKAPDPLPEVASGKSAIVYVELYAAESAKVFDTLADTLTDDESVVKFQKQLWDATAKARWDAQQAPGSIAPDMQAANEQGVDALKAKVRDIAQQYQRIADHLKKLQK